MRTNWITTGLLLLMCLSTIALSKQNSAVENCIVCNGPMNLNTQQIQYNGRWVSICPGKCFELWSANPETFFLKLQSRGALFDENSITAKSAGNGMMYLGTYFLIGLIFGAMCAYVALTNGRNPLFWFTAGLLLNILAFIAILLKGKGDLTQLPAGIPQGLSKIPSTFEPIYCPNCSEPNHPSAGHCSACNVNLEPAVDSEASKLSDQASE